MSKIKGSMSGVLEPYLRRKRFKIIKEYLNNPKGTVLDIGCEPTLDFLRAVNFSKKYGIDRTEQKVFDKNIKYIKLNLKRKIPFKKIKFDCIVMQATLEHLDYPIEILNECFRILKDGGKLIMTVPTINSHLLLTILAKLRLIDADSFKEHKSYFSDTYLKNIIKEIGFSKVLVKRVFFNFNILVVADK